MTDLKLLFSTPQFCGQNRPPIQDIRSGGATGIRQEGQLHWAILIQCVPGSFSPTSPQLTGSTQPCIPTGSLNRVPASVGVRAGMSPLPGGR